MIYRSLIALAALCGVVLSSEWIEQPRAQFFVPPITIVRAYQGPGDIVGSAVAMFGLEAYNAAYATGSNPAADLCDSGGTNCATFNILKTGHFDTATASGATACGGNPCVSVSKLYDQTGGGQHFVQATNANRPAITFNCINSTLACITFDGTNDRFTATGAATHASPYTIAEVWNCTSSGSQKPVFKDSAGFHGTQCLATTNNYECYGGTSLTKAETAGTPHTFVCIVNGASGSVTVDTSSTTGATNTGTFGTAWQLGTNNSSQFFKGNWNELVFYGSALTAANITALHNNQCIRYGIAC
jgi:hypothetical protein